MNAVFVWTKNLGTKQRTLNKMQVHQRYIQKKILRISLTNHRTKQWRRRRIQVNDTTWHIYSLKWQLAGYVARYIGSKTNAMEWTMKHWGATITMVRWHKNMCRIQLVPENSKKNRMEKQEKGLRQQDIKRLKEKKVPNVNPFSTPHSFTSFVDIGISSRKWN